MAIPTPIAQRACERSSDWRRGGAASPDPERVQCAGSPDPEDVPCAGSPDPELKRDAYSTQSVRDVALAEHAALPGADLGDHVGEQAQAVVRRQDGDAEQVTNGDQDEQVLHAGAGA